jgi:Cof subfamily protein (haloacid dehalogenase superfamily)
MPHNIKLIAIDIDGTLLNSQHEISPRTSHVIRQARARGIVIVPATGRCPSATQAIMARMDIAAPGIFLQGLLVLDIDGKVLYERTMEAMTVRQVIAFAKENGLTPLIYSGSRIIVEARVGYADALIPYSEPIPEVISPLESVPDNLPVHKVLLLEEPSRVAAARQELMQILNGQASITQALPIAMEILPHGTSKGEGFRHLLNALNIPPTHAMAVGDGENDLEMIQIAGMGVAMGSAPDHVKSAADAVVSTNDEDGLAEALERFVC